MSSGAVLSVCVNNYLLDIDKHVSVGLYMGIQVTPYLFGSWTTLIYNVFKYCCWLSLDLNTFLCSAVGIGVKLIFIKCLSVSGPGNPDAHKGALGMLKFIYGDFEKNRVNGLKDACRKEVKK